MLFARLPSLLLLTPFVLVFLYAAWHEYNRFKRDGASSYGLSYDPETNSTYVTALADEEDHFDLEDFNPDDTQDPVQTASAPAEADPKEQDKTS
ncbi:MULTISPECIES: hypothetical protein [Shimia]|uniref:hypothetical protein n=1 Tax=Shimia TaxID=573139 RepID=UPI001FB4FE02|nr:MULTISPECIES: hypothetical protein [Shimia]MDV4145615.1 hypothetical protein [Shimia sp. FJ5]